MESDLLHELLNYPAQFVKNKYKGYNLLNEYLGGLDIQTLIPALQSENRDINNIAVSIISELNVDSCTYLLPYLLPLINMPDSVYTQYLLSAISKGTLNNNCNKFAHIIMQLGAPDYRRVISAMNLISIANACQLENSLAALRQTEQDTGFVAGLELLINIKDLHHDDIVNMMKDNNKIIQYFGAIISAKLYDTHPELLNSAYHSSNHLLSKFSEIKKG